MQAAIVIPARLQSSRFPRKLLARLGDLPLIVRVCQQAAKVEKNILVATDSKEIADVVEAAGFASVMPDGDFNTGSERVAAATRDRSEDIIVNWQGDEPFMAVEAAQAAIDAVKAGADIGTCTTDFRDFAEFQNPNRVKALARENGEALYFSRSPIPHGFSADDSIEKINASVGCHLGIYAYRRDVLQKLASMPPCELEQRESLEQLRALHYGYKIGIRRVQCNSFGIDTEADLKKAEAYLQKSGMKE